MVESISPKAHNKHLKIEFERHIELKPASQANVGKFAVGLLLH